MAKTLEMTAFFAEKAAGYEEHMRAVFGGRRRMRKFFRLIAEQINPTMEPEAVLDLGCGTGLAVGKTCSLSAVWNPCRDTLTSG